MEHQLIGGQKQVMSQSQIQSLEILAMDSISLNGLVQKEYLENPIIEQQLPDGQSRQAHTEREDICSRVRERRPDVAVAYSGSRPLDEGERSYEIPDRTPGSVRDHIMMQLPSGKYTEAEKRLIEYMIGSLDENGFFTASIQETARINKVTEGLVSSCLEDLRRLEPAGIFAAGLKECLLCQIDQLEGNQNILRRLVEDHLEDVGAGRISNITRDLKISTAEARKRILDLKELDPRPLSGFYWEQTQYIVPDIILHIQDGQWEISLNDQWVSSYRISDHYLRMMEDTRDEELKKYFNEKLERARMLMKNIEQRQDTIRRITQAVLEWQLGYFQDGEPLRPMTMADIADRIQMSPSTVSRGVKGKYIQSPRKTILFRELFTQAIASKEHEGGQGHSPDHIKKRISALVASENVKKPYSDQTLARLLEEEGIHVSRRTVAKYRDELHILGSFQRRV